MAKSRTGGSERRLNCRREELRRKVAEHRESGDQLLLGRSLLALGEFYYFSGTGDDTHAVSSAGDCLFEAIHLLREAGDLRGLAKALRSPSLTFVDGIDRPAMLRESQEISASIGDWESLGWAILNRARPTIGAIKKAQSYFRKVNCHRGLSVSYTKAAHLQRRRNPAPYYRAIFHAQTARNLDMVGHASMVAGIFLRDQISTEEGERLKLETYRWGRLSKNQKRIPGYLRRLTPAQKRKAREKQKPFRLRLAKWNRKVCCQRCRPGIVRGKKL